MASATSSGAHMRLSIVPATDACLRACGQFLVHGESTKPGATALTRISGAKARARLRVRLIKAALVAAYAMLLAWPPRPAIDAVFTIAPRVDRRCGAAASTQRKGPSRLTPRRRCHNGSLIADRSWGSNGLSAPGVPALF